MFSIPLSMQVKLLRALEEGEVRPVGGTHSITVNVRFLAATNHNLEKAQILSVLHETGWNQTEVSQALGISRTTLWRKMKTYQLAAPT